jgi:threonine dehydrogenase-like Zn-dependent dehydrogenase
MDDDGGWPEYVVVPAGVPELVALAELGRFDFARSSSDTLPLRDAAATVERLERKEGNPIRLVLVP